MSFIKIKLLIFSNFLDLISLLFCVMYKKGAYAVMIVSKKNFKLVPDNCKSKVIHVSQGRKM